MDYGDMYGRLDQLLGLRKENGYHVKYSGDDVEFRLSGLYVDLENMLLAPASPDNSKGLLADAAPNAEIPTASIVPIVPEISVQPIDPTSAANVTAAADTADSTGTEQSQQVEPVKPEDPTEPPTPKEDSAISNPAKPPKYKPEDTVKSESSSPKGGDKNEKGQIWFPGFGWVDDEGANTGTQVGNDDDELTGNKVGSMD